MKKLLPSIISAFCLLILSACAPPGSPAEPAQTATASVSPTVFPTASPTAAPSATVTRPVETALPVSTASPTPSPSPEICPPLDGLEWTGLSDRVTNPFNPPRPGSDEPHQGVDIADFLPDTRVAVRGRGVRAVLDGTVSTVLGGDFPFGYGLIVESDLNGPLLSQLPVPPPYDELPLPTTLTCPGVLVWDVGRGPESLYLLYAHLDALPDIRAGDEIGCGDTFGAVGDSGNALNPHLHLEIRVGPSGADFPGMTHYNPSAGAAEMDAYCAWRVSGIFRLVDPWALFNLANTP